MELFAQAAAQQSIEQKALQVRLHDLEDRTASLEAQLAESLAGRAQDAAEYAQRLGTMEAHCEAELNGVVKGAGVGLGYQSLFRDLGQAAPVRVWVGSSASIGICSRQCLGPL